jgi:hypothetical protein
MTCRTTPLSIAAQLSPFGGEQLPCRERVATAGMQDFFMTMPLRCGGITSHGRAGKQPATVIAQGD